MEQVEGKDGSGRAGETGLKNSVHGGMIGMGWDGLPVRPRNARMGGGLIIGLSLMGATGPLPSVPVPPRM